MKTLLVAWLLACGWHGAACGVEFSEVQAAGKRITVCRVDLRREKLRLFWRDGTGEVFKRFDPLTRALQAEGGKLTFGMNAGMFQPGWLPVGLFVVGGQTLSPLNTAVGKGNFFLKPNGVFLVSDMGAQVVETSEYPGVAAKDRVLLATQSGPLLVRNGTIHPAFREDSTSRLVRNGVGVLSGVVVLFAISEEPVNFYEFAACFRDTLHCPDALYLDGTVSSLYAPTLKRNDSRVDLGPMIGVVE